MISDIKIQSELTEGQLTKLCSLFPFEEDNNKHRDRYWEVQGEKSLRLIVGNPESFKGIVPAGVNESDMWVILKKLL